jgi:hypothetical protein
LRAQAVQSALQEAFAKRGPGLEKAKHTPAWGRISYSLYVLSCLGAVLSIIGLAGSVLNPGGLIATRLPFDARWTVVVLFGFAISAALGKRVDQVRSATFSRFWHNSRQDLRTALKGAKSLAATAR